MQAPSFKSEPARKKAVTDGQNGTAHNLAEGVCQIGRAGNPCPPHNFAAADGKIEFQRISAASGGQIGRAASGGQGLTALPADEWRSGTAGRGCPPYRPSALPVRKRLDHHGPRTIDTSRYWYFITICAENHAPWVADPSKIHPGRAASPLAAADVPGRAASPLAAADVPGRAASPLAADVVVTPPLAVVAPVILHEARENHIRGIWFLSLFLVMPDHVHFIVHGNAEYAIANFKHLLSRRYGLKFQRDFFDTRLRDDAHFAEKYGYILGNPVRKGLCGEPSQWPYSIAFSRATGDPIDYPAVATNAPNIPLPYKMADSVGQNGMAQIGRAVIDGQERRK